MFQNHKLIATFETTIDMETIKEAMAQEAQFSGPEGLIHDCLILDGGEGRRTFVSGPAQGIMFLIGRIAAFGEDGLIAVTPSN